MPSYKRAVVLMKAFIGDAVMATPLLEGLREQVETIVVAPPHIRDVLGPRWGDAFIPIEGRGFLPRVRALSGAHADLAIVLNRSFRSALAARAAGIKTRVGNEAEGRGFLLTHRVSQDWDRHESESYVGLAEAVGFQLGPMHPYLALTEEEQAKGKELLSGADLALQPGARHNYKRLSIETLSKIVAELQSDGFNLVLVGGKEESEYADQLMLATAGLTSLVGKCTLRETMGVLAGARVTVGADTGVMHLAAAVGSPTVTVFEPSQPASRWGHLYPPHQVVQAPESGIGDVGPGLIIQAVRTAVESPVAP